MGENIRLAEDSVCHLRAVTRVQTAGGRICIKAQLHTVRHIGFHQGKLPPTLKIRIDHIEHIATAALNIGKTMANTDGAAALAVAQHPHLLGKLLIQVNILVIIHQQILLCQILILIQRHQLHTALASGGQQRLNADKGNLLAEGIVELAGITLCVRQIVELFLLEVLFFKDILTVFLFLQVIFPLALDKLLAHSLGKIPGFAQIVILPINGNISPQTGILFHKLRDGGGVYHAEIVHHRQRA